jgi:hypothetical protein
MANPASLPMHVARQPVIILGMHRSGTSMVSELLDQLGLFVGRELQDDHESTFFLELNDQIMSRVSAAWDYPKPMLDYLACDEAVRMTAGALAADLSSRRIKTFLGRATLQDYSEPWGWKDPRTVFTLPIWLKLFPKARLVYIVRNAIDVAKSLMVRERKLLKLRTERFDERMAKFSFRSALDRAGYKGSPRCLNLRGGFELWDEYVQQADHVLNGLSNPTLTLKYEDMLADPKKHLPQLAKFCELEPTEDAIAKAIGQIDGTRALAFTTDPASAAFYETVKDNVWMKKFGY